MQNSVQYIVALPCYTDCALTLFICLQVIFRYALAIFKYKEEDILKIHDNVEIYQYLRFFTKTVTDGRWAITILQKV